jgi:hypothetical protein
MAKPKATINVAAKGALHKKQTAVSSKKRRGGRDDDSDNSSSDNESVDSPEAQNRQWPSYLAAASPADSIAESLGGSDDEDEDGGGGITHRRGGGGSSEDSLSEGGSSNESDDEDDDNAPDQTLMFMIQSMVRSMDIGSTPPLCRYRCSSNSTYSLADFVGIVLCRQSWPKPKKAARRSSSFCRAAPVTAARYANHKVTRVRSFLTCVHACFGDMVVCQVKEGLQSWFSHVESDKLERVEQLKQDMEEEQVRVVLE